MSDEQNSGEELVERLKELRAEIGSLAKVKNPQPVQIVSLIKDMVVPLLAAIGEYQAKNEEFLGDLIGEYDERITALETPTTQIAPEDAQKIIEHLNATNAVLANLISASPAGTAGLAELKEILANGQALIEVIEEHTLTSDGEEDEDESEDEDDDEDDGDRVH